MGKRTVSKLNAFDFIVTIAPGSTLATVLLEQVRATARRPGRLRVGHLSAVLRHLAQRAGGLTAALGHRRAALALPSWRVPARTMRACRATLAEVRAAIRVSGHLDLAVVGAVVLKTDASFSVIKRPGSASRRRRSTTFRASRTTRPPEPGRRESVLLVALGLAAAHLRVGVRAPAPD